MEHQRSALKVRNITMYATVLEGEVGGNTY